MASRWHLAKFKYGALGYPWQFPSYTGHEFLLSPFVANPLLLLTNLNPLPTQQAHCVLLTPGLATWGTLFHVTKPSTLPVPFPYLFSVVAD